MALKPKKGDTKKINGKVYRYQMVKGKLQWVPIGTGGKIVRGVLRAVDSPLQYNKYEYEHKLNKDKSAYERAKNTGSTGLSNIPKDEGNAVIKGPGGKAKRINPDYGVEGQPDRVVNKNEKNKSTKSENKNRLQFGKIGSLKIGKGGFSARQIDRRIKNLKRKNKASNRMKIKQLEALKKKKYGS